MSYLLLFAQSTSLPAIPKTTSVITQLQIFSTHSKSPTLSATSFLLALSRSNFLPIQMAPDLQMAELTIF